MQGITRGVLFLILLLTAGRAWAEAPTLEQMQPWNPSGSYPGGAQSDPRLDQSVRFWRTAIPLAEVFAQVKQQTGVEVLCWPAGDQNERIRVTLYLNEQQPPTLRALLAQLAWVTDCAFLTQGEPGKQRYLLLSSNVAEGAEARLTASLSPQQWHQARGEGLRMDTDLSPSQREIAHEDVGRLTSFDTLPRPPEEYVLRMREGEVRYPPGRGPQNTFPPAPWHIEYVREGAVEGQTSLPSVLITFFGELFYKLPPPAEAQ